MVLELLHQSTKKHMTNRSYLVEESLGCQYFEMHTPAVLDLTQRKEYASQAALWGIEVSFCVDALILTEFIVYAFCIISYYTF